MHPNVWISNGIQYGKMADVDMTGLRTCDDNKKWEWDMSSTRLRDRIDVLLARVRDEGEAAFVPDVRVKMYMWNSWDECRNEGPFLERWYHMNSFDAGWDVTLMNERLGRQVLRTGPFNAHPRALGVCANTLCLSAECWGIPSLRIRPAHLW